MYEPCMCGASDCRSCFPQNFQRGVYVAEMTEEAIEEMHDMRDLAEECRAEDRLEALRSVT